MAGACMEPANVQNMYTCMSGTYHSWEVLLCGCRFILNSNHSRLDYVHRVRNMNLRYIYNIIYGKACVHICKWGKNTSCVRLQNKRLMLYFCHFITFVRIYHILPLSEKVAYNTSLWLVQSTKAAEVNITIHHTSADIPRPRSELYTLLLLLCSTLDQFRTMIEWNFMHFKLFSV